MWRGVQLVYHPLAAMASRRAMEREYWPLIGELAALLHRLPLLPRRADICITGQLQMLHSTTSCSSCSPAIGKSRVQRRLDASSRRQWPSFDIVSGICQASTTGCSFLASTSLPCPLASQKFLACHPGRCLHCRVQSRPRRQFLVISHTYHVSVFHLLFLRSCSYPH